ncbi:LysR family transcriptional regulator [Marinomonas sp. 15G1-11]|uniref:LysR family transcriptional regulator n=1 Tax=Marinomonas phaeophyticola TaxID=3004091 RepID=A0ABT4JV14_9GAMM|nr:LysR family transcriptional regulator [Marinomonas sp. 15G1-11]MCZ2722229.1 LysR family transcriptional regulator [Marinomonas sp. 15G1-11]
MMDISELLTFIKVAETGSFSEAAEKLFVTQPAISKRIASLEQSLNIRLFDRIGRKVLLTESGLRLLPKAKSIALELNEIKHSMSQQEGEISGELRIATSHHVGLRRLPTTLKRFQSECSNVILEADFTQSEEAYQQVIRGEVELGIITLSNQPDTSIESIPVWSDPFVCAVSKDHPLRHLKSVDLIQLASYPCVLPKQNTFTRQMVDQSLAKYGLRPNIRMSTNNFETLTMLTSIGWGWSLLPSTLINDDLCILDLTELNIARQLGVIYHKQRTLSRAAEMFIRIMMSEATSIH